MNNVNLYTLLYVDLTEVRQLAGQKWKGIDRLDIFVKNACVLDKSLYMFSGFNWRVKILTNNKEIIDSSLYRIGYQMEVEEIPFQLAVPLNIRFYSAHFKIDVFKWFAEKEENEYFILLDNDVVCLGKFPEEFDRVVAKGLPMCYNLSRMETNVRLDDVFRIDDNVVELTWKGGEFIGGTPRFFGYLYNDIMQFSTCYFLLLAKEKLFHIGDEMLVSISLDRMQQRDLKIVDAGMIGVIHRYWSITEKWGITHYKVALMHLPGDKIMINALNLNKFNSLEYFYFRYRCYRILCYFNCIIKNLLHKIKRVSKRSSVD